MVKVNVKGIDELIIKFAKMNVNVQNEIKGIIEFNAGEIEIQAINNAPGAGDILPLSNGEIQKLDIGINQFIFNKLSNNGYKATIGIEKEATKLAAYIEFGTGISAAYYVPMLEPEFQKIAKSFYINGKGTIMAHPFLIPAYMKYREIFIKEIKEYAMSLKL